MKAKIFAASLGILASHAAFSAVSTAELEQSIQRLQQQIDELKASTAEPKNDDDFVKIGGAVRFGYQYNEANRDSGGDMRFDTFRLDVQGKVKGISLLSKWRWFQNRKALIQVAEMGYDFSERSSVKAGLTLVPFGNQEYNSHNFDLSPNFALGLEDNYQFGSTYIYQGDSLNVQASFFKNDSSLGAMGENSYSPTLNSFDNAGTAVGIGAYNTGALRVVNLFEFADDVKIEVGASGLYAGVFNKESKNNLGEQQAYALHSTIRFQRFHLQLQATHYEYDLREDISGLNMAYYGGVNNTIATRANSYTANIKYSLPVNLGPIELIEFYNDYTLVTDKPNQMKDSYDNTLGMGVAAGTVYVFVDWHIQQNMGDMTAAVASTSHYLNVNFGYYF